MNHRRSKKRLEFNSYRPGPGDVMVPGAGDVMHCCGPSGEALESRAQGQSVLKPRDAQPPHIVTRFRPPRGRALRGAARALSRFARTLQALWAVSFSDPRPSSAARRLQRSAIQAASRPSATGGGRSARRSGGRLPARAVNLVWKSPDSWYSDNVDSV